MGSIMTGNRDIIPSTKLKSPKESDLLHHPITCLSFLQLFNIVKNFQIIIK